MSYFEKLSRLGLMVVCRHNRLGTTTMFAVSPEDLEGDGGRGIYLVPFKTPCDNLDDALDCLPEWRTVDFHDDEAGKAAKLLYEKLTLQGDYATWDERLLKHEGGHAAHGGPISENMLDFLIGFEHRPESERFKPVDDAPAPPPELVENLNLQDP